MTRTFALRAWLIALLSGAALYACDVSAPIKFAGETQGTTYHVTAVACVPQQPASAQQRVENRLAEIDLALSSYRDDSELLRFNRAAAGEWHSLGADLHAVLKIAQQISAQSDGAFDATIAPLIDLWGFGRQRGEALIPDESAIARARALVDYRRLEVDTAQPRAKKHGNLTVDVNGIAQGYTVDQLAKVLSDAGCSDYLVEVGGELRLAGRNAERKLWRIGIEKPALDFGGAQQTLRATNVGVTTAGDYREYFEKDGVRYSHTIDPRTGKPIAHKLAAVTVIADSAALADGLDTALEVMGPEAAFEFAQKNRIAAFFIVREGDHFTTKFTAAMANYLSDN